MKNENKVNQVEQAKRIENWDQVRDELINALTHLYYIGAPLEALEEVLNFELYISDLYESLDKALQIAKAVQKLTLEQLEESSYSTYHKRTLIL